MPLSAPADRQPIHTRRIECQGYRRADGLWDIEGHLVDTKAYPFGNQFRGTIEPGEALHEMWLRLTVDETLTIHAVEAATDNSPYRMCPDIAPDYAQLAGLQIKGGFTGAVRARLSGAAGCTHLTELLGPLATTAFQTIVPWLMQQKRQRADGGGSLESMAGSGSGARRPPLLDTCHTFASDSPVVRQEWPAFYTGPVDAAVEAAAD